MSEPEKSSNSKQILEGTQRAKNFWKVHGTKIRTSWESVRTVVSEVGKLQDNNIFSRVDIGIRLFGVGKNLWNTWKPIQKTEPGYDWCKHWNQSELLGGLVIQNLTLSLFKDLERRFISHSNFHFMYLEGAGYQLWYHITPPNLERMEEMSMASNDVRLRGNSETFYVELRKRMIEQYGKCIVLDFNDGSFSGMGEREIYQSRTQTELGDMVDKYQRAGIGRSILLYGPPGTGKTSIANFIMKEYSDFSVMIKNMCEFEKTDKYWHYLACLNPDVVVFNDLDRVGYLEDLLEHFEGLKRMGKIVIATINHLKDMDSALIRPGRFDRLVEVDKLDLEFVDTLVGGDLELRELCKGLSAASIQEMMVRVRVEGRDAAIRNVGDIVARDLRIRKEYSEE